MQEELRKLNIDLFIEDNQVTIDSTDFSGFGATFDTHNDHRIAMSLSVISTILETPSIIKNADCVNKSYPDFFNDLIKLGINVEIIK